MLEYSYAYTTLALPNMYCNIWHTVIRIEDLIDDEREELLRYATLIDALLAVELHKEALLQIIWREARKRVELFTIGQEIHAKILLRMYAIITN